MMESEFKEGRFYFTRANREALCIFVDVLGGAVMTHLDARGHWFVFPDGRCSGDDETPNDIVGEIDDDEFLNGDRKRPSKGAGRRDNDFLRRV